MVLRWMMRLTVLLGVLPSALIALIPEEIYQCYRTENYGLFNRYNRQGMSMDQFIGLIERLEHSSSGNYMSQQKLATTLLRRFRYDGIIDQIVNKDISYLEPFTIIQPENAKFQMLQRLINLGDTKFPEEEFSLEEKCTMHWLLSHSVNETQRDDESSFCGRPARRRRAPRRKSYKSSSSSSSSSGSASSQQRSAGLVGNLDDKDASRCPLESGIVYSPYGPVAAGTLLAGMAAGLSEQDVAVEDVVAADTMTLQGLSQQQRSLQVNNIWAATIAGDVAQTALHYEGRGSQPPNVVGPKGFWNCSYCPHEYSLLSRGAITALTNAEIYGGIDGYLIGSQLNDWSHFSQFRLSTVLRMYYSPEGVSYDRRFRACDRLLNFQNSDLVDQDALQTQAVNFGFAYYASDVGSMPTLSQDGLDDAMAALVSAVLQDLDAFAGNSMSDDGPGCKNVPPAGSSSDKPVCDTMADLTVVLDTSQGDSSMQAQKVFLSEMALAMNIGWNKSYMHVVSGVDGTVLADKWNYTNKAQLACDIQRIKAPLGRMDLVATLNSLYTYFTAQLDLEAANVDARSNTQVLLLRASTRINNEDDIVDRLNALCDAFPDLNIFTLTDNSNVFRGVQQKMNRRQFLSDNMFTTESSQQAIRDTLVPKINKNMCQTPSRFIYPPCRTDGASFSFNENSHEYTYYVAPGHITYLRMGPEQFFSSTDLKIQFASTFGSLQFCVSRSEPMPADGGNDVTCMATESSSTSQVEFNFHQPCDEDHLNGNCNAFFFSIQQNPTSASSSYSNLCTDNECPFPDSIRYTITHKNMRCNSATSAAGSALLLAAAILVRKLVL